jgi:hypothetical protein
VRRWARALVPVAALALLTVPFLVFRAAGWVHLSLNHGTALRHGLLHDTTSLYVWTVLAVVYLVWVVALVAGIAWAFDRLDYHYQPYDRPARLTRRQQRRRHAGMAHLRAQQQQQAQLEGLRRAARESRRAAREPDAAGDGRPAGESGGRQASDGKGRPPEGAAGHDSEE